MKFHAFINFPRIQDNIAAKNFDQNEKCQNQLFLKLIHLSEIKHVRKKILEDNNILFFCFTLKIQCFSKIVIFHIRIDVKNYRV